MREAQERVAEKKKLEEKNKIEDKDKKIDFSLDNLMITLLDDSSSQRRTKVGEIFLKLIQQGKIAEPKFGSLFTKALAREKDDKVRNFLILCLGELKFESSLKELHTILLYDLNANNRTNAAIALGKIKSKDSIDYLTRAKEDDDEYSVKYESKTSLDLIFQKK